jgi:hypothetical protein
MNHNRTHILGLLVATSAAALILAACGGASGDGTVPTATATLPPLVTSTPTATPTAPAEPLVAAASLEESADVFAGALVSGDLVALMTSFAPAGLGQAMALADSSGSDGTDVVTAAKVASIGEPTAPSGTRSVVFELTAPAGVSELVTEWGLQTTGVWQIVSLVVTPG